MRINPLVRPGFRILALALVFAFTLIGMAIASSYPMWLNENKVEVVAPEIATPEPVEIVEARTQYTKLYLVRELPDGMAQYRLKASTAPLHYSIGGQWVDYHIVQAGWPWKTASADSANVSVNATANDGARYTGSADFDIAGVANQYHFLGDAGGTTYSVSSIFARFVDITISGTVNSAYLTYYPRYDGAGTALLKIYGVDEDNPAAPTDNTTFDADPLTDAGIDWDGAWTIEVRAESPDIKDIVQELVDSYDITNEAIMFQVKNDGGASNNFNRPADSGYGAQYAPWFTVDFTTAAGAGLTVDGTNNATDVNGVVDFAGVNGVSLYPPGGLGSEWYEYSPPVIYYDPTQESANNTHLAWAAADLETYLEEITEEVWTVNTTDLPDPGIFITVNATWPEVATLGNEAFNIYTADDGIHVVGKTARGASRGAYELLEDLGVYFLGKNPIWTVVPDSEIALGSVNFTGEPTFESRSFDWETQDNVTLQQDWIYRNRLYGETYYAGNTAYDEVVNSWEWDPLSGDVYGVDWNNNWRASDLSDTNYADYAVPPESWSTWIGEENESMTVSRAQWKLGYENASINQTQVQIEYGGANHTAYDGAVADATWGSINWTADGGQTVTGFSVRFYNSHGSTTYDAYVYNVELDIGWYYRHADFQSWFTGNPPNYWQFDPNCANKTQLFEAYSAGAAEWLDATDGVYKVYANKEYVERKGVYLSPNDYAGYWDPPYDNTDTATITDVVFLFAQEIADNLSASYPDDYVSLLSYSIYAGEPTINLDGNVVVIVTDRFANASRTMEDRIDSVIAQGANKTGVLHYWGERSNEIPAQFVTYEKLRQLPWWADKGVTIYTGDADDSWGAKGLMWWLATKFAWDAYSDMEALKGEFCAKAFGPAADNMRAYYDVVYTDNYSMKQAYNYLDAAFDDAEGNAAVLARIRYLMDYAYYVWKYHVKYGGIEVSDGMPTNELADLYTLASNLRYKHTLYWKYVDSASDNTGIRKELISNRGYDTAGVNALQDFTEPTDNETDTRFAEGLAHFQGLSDNSTINTFVNPREMDLEACGNATVERFDPFDVNYSVAMVQCTENDIISVNISGASGGAVNWYNEAGIFLETANVTSSPTGTIVTFNATDAGIYYVHTLRTLQGWEPFRGTVEIENEAAAFICPRYKWLIQVCETSPTNQSPSLWTPAGGTDMYFYVPEGTDRFAFGADITGVYEPSGNLTGPLGTKYEFAYTITGQETIVENPVAGLWQINLYKPSREVYFWLRGIPPLVWHDAEYLLIPG